MSLSTDPLSRPPSYTTLRQALAKVNGTTHFQIASSAMAPPPAPPRPSSAQQQRRGRSPTRKHLWTYSPDKARAEAEEEDRLLREERAWLRYERQQQEYKYAYLAAQSDRPVSGRQPHTIQQSLPIQQHAPSLSHQAVASTSAIGHFEAQRGVASSSELPSGTQLPLAPPTSTANTISTAATPKQAQWPEVITSVHAAEAIPTGTSLVPILGRPPGLLPSPTSLERAALDSLEEDESEVDLEASMRYLRPPPSKAAPRVLYTRSQLPWIDEASRHLWHALHNFQAVTEDYAGDYAATAAAKMHSKNALAPVPPHCAFLNGNANAAACPFAAASLEALASTPKAASTSSRIRSTFNWSSLSLPLHIHRTWYGVSFRSIRSPITLNDTALNEALYTADRLSHEEAVGAPGAGGLLMYWYGVPASDTGANLATCIWTSRRDAIVASRLPMHGKAVRHAQGAYTVFELTRYKITKRAGEAHVRIEEWDEVEDLPW